MRALAVLLFTLAAGYAQQTPYSYPPVAEVIVYNIIPSYVCAGTNATIVVLVSNACLSTENDASCIQAFDIELRNDHTETLTVSAEFDHQLANGQQQFSIIWDEAMPSLAGSAWLLRSNASFVSPLLLAFYEPPFISKAIELGEAIFGDAAKTTSDSFTRMLYRFCRHKR
jgi:hypothetical protein